MTRIAITAAAMLVAAAALSAGGAAQRADAFGASRDHPAIRYTDGAVATPVSELNERLERGAAHLEFDPVSGYLRSLLSALQVPIESQLLVFSETSFQARFINRQNPRAVFFTDRLAVGFVRGGEVLEVAAQDPRQGTIFYSLTQAATPAPRLVRNEKCLACHLSWDTLAVPGPFVLTTLPRQSDNDYANGGPVDHRTPIAERWGGWYVTGARVPARQMGNVELVQPKLPPSGPKPALAPRSVEGLFDLRGYPTPYSDVVALMVLEHQAHATNLITRAGWEFRQAEYEARTRDGGLLVTPGAMALPARTQQAVEALVEYFLFADEAALPEPIRGSSGFAEKFSAAGPRDSKGRGLQELQLETRLLRYPCSFMIYSPGFEGLPDEVKAAVSARISDVLDGRDSSPKYRHLSPDDRRAIAEILRETAPGVVRHFL